jgi:hypothetical protein
MAIKFTDLQGKASKSGPDRFKPAEGVNKIRIIGDVVPGYKYWLKTKDNSPVPADCLSFNRDTERFDNSRVDPVRRHFPEMKCSWAYQSLVIDRADGKVKLFDHKKKLFESVLETAKKKFGDPTDPENGWDIVFTKKKTGPQAFNVEYALEVFDLENSALTDEDKKAMATAEEAFGTIADITKLPTADEQETFIKTYILADEEEVDDNVARELMEDDIPQ